MSPDVVVNERDKGKNRIGDVRQWNVYLIHFRT